MRRSRPSAGAAQPPPPSTAADGTAGSTNNNSHNNNDSASSAFMDLFADVNGEPTIKYVPQGMCMIPPPPPHQTMASAASASSSGPATQQQQQQQRRYRVPPVGMMMGQQHRAVQSSHPASTAGPQPQQQQWHRNLQRLRTLSDDQLQEINYDDLNPFELGEIDMSVFESPIQNSLKRTRRVADFADGSNSDGNGRNKRIEVVNLDVDEDSKHVQVTQERPTALVTRENLTSRIKENVTCSICKDILYNAVTLVPCSHLLCSGCFAQLKESRMPGKVISCPECRKATTMVIDAPPGLRSIISDYLALHPEDKRSEDAIRQMDLLDKKVQRGTPIDNQSQTSTNSRIRRSFDTLFSPHAPTFPDAAFFRLTAPPPLAAPIFGLPFDAQPPTPHRGQAPFSARSRRDPAFPNGTTYEEAVKRFMEVTFCPRQVAVEKVREAIRDNLNLDAAIAIYLDSNRRSTSSSSSAANAWIL